ncbi:FAD binding domain-containing protein [Lentzea sp. NPDC058450]|uniref:FAD binding domain-containing protein n=1 Tax=Lentzea sp. NPDC058450 TaxID=3346505 RepID=UPI00365A2FB5
MRPFRYVKATDLGEAVAVLVREPGSMVLAGGTNVVDLMKLGVLKPGTLVDITGLGLDRVEHRPDGSTLVGATVRNSELAGDEVTRARFPVLSEAILAGASGQVRGAATTAGNLLQRTRCVYFQDVSKPCNKREPGTGCAAIGGLHRDLAVVGTSPACVASHPSDMAVAMAALDAKVHVRLAYGAEAEFALEDFYRKPGFTPDRENVLQVGDLVTGVTIPALPDGTISRYRKVRDRASYAFAVVSVAAVLRLTADGVVDHVRIALGGIGSQPWRAFRTEELLLGERLDRDLVRGASAEVFRDAQPLPQNDFKIGLAVSLITTTLLGMAEELA